MSDRAKAAAPWAAALLSAVMAGAGTMPDPAAEAPPGAASCSGCHPAQANAATPVPPLGGQDAGAIVAAMQAFRGRQRESTVMDRIATGFSDGEIAVIAAWFMTQR